MKPTCSRTHQLLRVAGTLASLTLAAGLEAATSTNVTRLTPPSVLFSFNDPGRPVTARFLPGQRFDLQATVVPDAGASITNVVFLVDNTPVQGSIAYTKPTVSGPVTNGIIATLRAYSNLVPGIHILSAQFTQSDGQTGTAQGNFEVVGITQAGRRARNIILCIGDGMGIAHRTAARLVAQGAQQGKANGLLAMDTFPFTGIVNTHSLDSIVTDSAPGAACYSTGNKNNNNQEGVFPDDTTDAFDNPRIENVGEFLHRTQGKALGIVTTADVFDATPAAMAVHTSNRGAGTGICDQYLDESANTGLTVLLGGGRKWFLPATNSATAQPTLGTARNRSTDYVLPADVVSAWGVPAGALDPNRDLLQDFIGAGWAYASDVSSLNSIPAGATRLLGLFSFSNMNVSKDKIDNRRGFIPPGRSQPVVYDYGFPDQPMLDEMTDKALQVLARNPNGFFLMVEGASIDKQAHNMDSDRWILETIEFDKAIARAQAFANANPDTLVIVTADHECAGINIIGASRVRSSSLANQIANPTLATNLFTNVVGGVTTVYTNIFANNLRTNVGTYELAGFPVYEIAPDGYPVTTDPDYKLIIGYASNADRFESYLASPTPIQDTQQPLIKQVPLKDYPALPVNRAVAGGFFITGQVPDVVAAHTASDIPVSAFGRGSSQFTGVMDNTDVFFKAMQAALGGVAR